MHSLPSQLRTATTCILYVVGGCGAFLWQLLPESGGFDRGLVPSAIVGVMPNFLPTAVLPTLIFLRPRVVTHREYVAMVLTMFAALSGYEVLQLWMPLRTFDVTDLVATGAGSCVGYLIGRIVFFGWLENSRAS